MFFQKQQVFLLPKDSLKRLLDGISGCTSALVWWISCCPDLFWPVELQSTHTNTHWFPLRATDAALCWSFLHKLLLIVLLISCVKNAHKVFPEMITRAHGSVCILNFVPVLLVNRSLIFLLFLCFYCNNEYLYWSHYRCFLRFFCWVFYSFVLNFCNKE